MITGNFISARSPYKYDTNPIPNIITGISNQRRLLIMEFFPGVVIKTVKYII